MAMTTKGLKASRSARISFLGSRGGIGTRRRCHGFKLVEFVAVLAIASTLGISAVSASYGSSSEQRQAPRANAQAALVDIAIQDLRLGELPLGELFVVLPDAEDRDNHPAEAELARPMMRGLISWISTKGINSNA